MDFQRLLKNLDERAPDDLALLLGLGDALQSLQKTRRRVHHAQVDLEIPLVERLDIGALALPQQAVVHKDTGELPADGLVQQRGGDGGVHAARQTEQHAGLADLGANVGHGMGDEVLRGPVLLGPADPHEEVADHVHAALGVENLGVKLDAVEAALAVLDTGKRRVLGHGGRDENRAADG